MTKNAPSAVARLEASLARIEADNDRTRIFVTVDRDRAMAAAQASDQRRAKGGRLGPLDGALVGIKDNLAVAGLPWTAGIGAYRNRIADEDAGVVARLRKAGAVIVGTLNLHEGALGATTDNPHFGRCLNPLRDGYTPGGSSGGSGAAVAGGTVDLAVGTDTMGSVRIPAAYCGIAGIKPTDGLVGRAGLSYLSKTLDTIGPLAKRVSQLKDALIAMAGADSDPGSLGAPVGWLDPDGALESIKIGIPGQLSEVDCEPEILKGLETAQRAFVDLGAKTDRISIEGWNPGGARRGGLLLCEAEGAAEMADLLEPGAEGISDEFRSLLAYGADVSSGRLVGSLGRIANARTGAERVMRGVDLILMPTAPQRAFAHGTPAPADQADLTALANFSGRPAVSIPVPLGEGALPAAVQLIGQPWTEFGLLLIAEKLESVLSA